MEPWAVSIKKKKLLVRVVVPPAPVHGAMGCAQKNNLLVSMAVPPIPIRVSSQRPLAPSVASVTSVVNDEVESIFRGYWS